MITTLPPKSVTRKLRIAEAVNHLIIIQSSVNTEFWGMPTNDILAELNADINETLTLFAGNTTLSVALNATQDTLNVIDHKGNQVFTARAPITTGRSDIAFDGSAFVLIPPSTDL